MALSMSRHNKGIYDLVTTFLFIMVVVFVVLAIIYVGKVIKLKKIDVNDEVIKYQDVVDAKNRILSNECHGIVIDESSANKSCSMTPGIIRGYLIEMLPYHNCTNETKLWSHMPADDDGEGQIFSYFAAIKSNTTSNICPGRLKVVY
jgi:hypothetical protein